MPERTRAVEQRIARKSSVLRRLRAAIAAFLLVLPAATAEEGQITVQAPEPAGPPILYQGELPADADADSIRVEAGDTDLPRKVEWRRPNVRVSWRSTGAGGYALRFTRGAPGGRMHQPEPAMIGTGDRVTYGRPGVRGKLSVGLWAHPAAIDLDQDGATDLIVGCPDHPSNGIYYFRNLGTNRKPLFARGEWMGPGKKDLVVADFNGDGKPDLVVSGGYYSDLRANRLSRFVAVPVARSYHVGRDDLWYPVDWDGDGRIDLLVGASDWREYGWDDAYNAKGEWTHGPLHGYVWFHRNVGTNEAPRYAEPVRLEAGGRVLDQYGSPAPNPVDWFGKGRLDLIAGSFLDTVTLYRNTGSRTAPQLAAGETLPFRMDICMIQPRVADWYGDGRVLLLVGEEDGRVSLVENTAGKGETPKLAPPRFLEQVDPYLKSGALSRPVAVDWNGDGKLDLLAGNSAGYLQYFENIGTREEPAFVDRGYLQAGGETIRIQAGENGSIQGPAEAKWGYTNPSVADWDLDGRPDILINSIRGEILWYRNTGSRSRPVLAAAQPVEVEWVGDTPKPSWTWWNPKAKQLVTQWRTTPKVVDWNRDGLPDLVTLDPEGYLALYARYREGGVLRLRPPERVFVDAESGKPLRLSAGRAGSSGRRKIDVVDWDGDGDLDLVVDSVKNAGWYENTGQGFRYRGDLARQELRGHNPCPAVADWNGDGKLDLLVGAEDGFFYFFDRRFLDSHVR